MAVAVVNYQYPNMHRPGFNQPPQAPRAPQAPTFTGTPGNPASRVTFYWLHGKNDEGRVVVLGPFGSESEAEVIGYDKCESFEVVPLTTRNLAEANRRLRMSRLEKGDSLSDVLKRAKHKFDGD